MAKKKRAINCAFHCRTCDHHFTSLAAFDAHRQGSHSENNRKCISLEDNDMYKHVKGNCLIANPEVPLHNIKVWISTQKMPEGAYAS